MVQLSFSFNSKCDTRDYFLFAWTRVLECVLGNRLNHYPDRTPNCLENMEVETLLFDLMLI